MSDADTRQPGPPLTTLRRLALDAHGTRATYRRGCRCLLCRVASARARADYRDPRRRPHYADAPQEV